MGKKTSVAYLKSQFTIDEVLKDIERRKQKGTWADFSEDKSLFYFKIHEKRRKK